MPHSTTGVVAMWGGTKDGEAGFIDWATKASNLKKPQSVKVVVEDMRSMETPPALMTNGFQLIEHKTAMTMEQFLDSSSPEGKAYLEEVYFPECKEIIRKMTGSDDIFVISHKVRKQNLTLEEMNGLTLGSTSLPIAHVDVDDITSQTTIVNHLGEEEANRMKSYKNWAQINVWRPINCPVQKWPLIFADKSGISDWDYQSHMATITSKNDPRVPSTGVRTKTHDTVLKNDERYQYRYTSKITPDEALVFFSFHSDPKLGVVHSAFWDDASPKDAPERYSIEIRSWVGYN